MLTTIVSCDAPGVAPPLTPARQHQWQAPPVDLAASPMGWRCTGATAGTACVDRARLAPAFVCTGDRCRQIHPRLPDDGDWSCAAPAGITICVGGEGAAGVAITQRAPGWQCGARGGSKQLASHEQTVCRDLDPDFPDGAPSGWHCRFEHEGAQRRICERAQGLHVVGDACDRSQPCVDGSVCGDGTCVLPAAGVLCWLDDDCEKGPCVLGTCRDTFGSL